MRKINSDIDYNIFKSLDLDKIILENKYNLFDGLKIMYNY